MSTRRTAFAQGASPGTLGQLRLVERLRLIEGRRAATDYTTAEFADRRARYLHVVTDLLVADLERIEQAWNPANAGNYYSQFVDPANGPASPRSIACA